MPGALTALISPEDSCAKLMNQREMMLKGIPQADVVWGDAEGSNVMVDKQSNAWITDFEDS